MKTIDEMFDLGVKLVNHVFPKTKQVFPTWLGVTEDGQLIPFSVPFLTDKDKVVAEVKSYFKAMGVVQYVSVIECWMLSAKKDSEPPNLQDIVDGKMAVSEHPNRVEAIWIAAESENGDSRMGMFKIIRPEGKDPYLSPLEKMGGGKMHEGRFVGLVGDQPTGILN